MMEKENQIIPLPQRRVVLIASLLLTVMAWLGGATVLHTLSDHHIHHHIHHQNRQQTHHGADEPTNDELCLLTVLSVSPFSASTPMDISVPVTTFQRLQTARLVAVVFSDPHTLFALRAPPAL
ncbi:MAG: hypothetical protein Q4E10_02790 [Porphyromonas sp.]|nr:hypothetical protein [Porphyromonas sp.]